jgi:hypothetical protein
MTTSSPRDSGPKMARRLSGAVLVGLLSLNLWATAAAATLAAQQELVQVSGTVFDETGGVMQAVTVRAFYLGGDDTSYETSTDEAGGFGLDLPMGEYLLRISASAFSTVEQHITLTDRFEPLTVTMRLDAVTEVVEVAADPAGALRLNSIVSLTALTLSEDELLGLPTDEEELVEHLMLLAGADPSGDLEEDISTFIIDGFDQGRLPDPNEIAQIIIDPVSLRVDGGEGPRIEIITRPGTGRWGGASRFTFADESLDAMTPGESAKPPRQTRDLDFDLSGPLVADLIDIDFEFDTRSQERAVNSLRAITPTDDLFEAVVRPETEHSVELDARVALSPSRTLGVNFDYETELTQNSGVGGFTLPERGAEENRDEWRFQISERRLGSNFTNDLRVRTSRDADRVVPVSSGVAVDVADAFNRGGGTERNRDQETRVQVEDRLRWQRGEWSYYAGLEGWYEQQHSVYENNFNGTFDFASLHDYCYATSFAGSNCAATQQIVADALAVGVVPLHTNARDESVAITGVPTTFSQTSGNAVLNIRELGVESFFQADRRFGEKASLRLGLRYEATNHSVNFLRFSPAVNTQYKPFGTTVVSVGARVNFRDFRNYAQLIRNDGMTHQSQLSISSPSFPDPFVDGAVTIDPNRTSLFQLSPDYRDPYSVTPQVSVTQQLPGTPLSNDILDLPREVRQDTVDRMRPFYPNVGNIYQIESTGRSSGRYLRVRFQRRHDLELLGLGLSGFVDYGYRWGEDDNDFNNPYVPEWGLSRRSHRFDTQFRIRLPRHVGVNHPVLRALARAPYQDMPHNVFVRAEAGRPYSIRSGRDLNGDQSARDRPPGVARNTETGPGRANVNMTLTKFVRPEVPPQTEGRRREGPSVRFVIRVSNLLNTSQVRGYSGVLSSPLFGLPTGYLRGRTVRLSVQTDF